MFHIGHLNIFKRAKEHCEYLIVAVSTDALCFEYKQKTPVIPFEERFEIVKSIRYVDKAVVQNNLNKVEAWNKYKYNVLFHGSDWKNTAMYNQVEAEMNALGVDVVYFPPTKDVSSSIIQKRMDDI